MCYDIKVSLERQLKVAKNYGDASVIARIEKDLLPLLDPIEKEFFQVSGFDHPSVFVLKKHENVLVPVRSVWGLIPDWARNIDQAHQLWNKTLNARVESLNEKATFREAFRANRCLLILDGFYDHKHYNGQTYPHFIYPAKEEYLVVAGISAGWIDPIRQITVESFSIVTTKSNDLMKRIHNNPKNGESRMPLILDQENSLKWIDTPEVQAEDLIHDTKVISPRIELRAHPVKRFRGIKQRNDHSVTEPFYYPELGKTLFD